MASYMTEAVGPEIDDRRIAEMLDRAALPFALIGLDGRFCRVNRAFEDLTGYPAAELQGLTFRDITPDPSVEISDIALRRLLHDDGPQHYEKYYRRKDGRIVPVALITDVCRDDGGAVRGYYTFVSDLTERRRAESALRESEERYRRLYDDAPIGYHEIDREGRVVAVNRAECDLLGYDREEILGRPVYDLVAEDRREEAHAAVIAKLAGERALEPFERPYETRDGRRLVLRIEERHVFDISGRIVGIRSTLQDVTAEKQTEDALIASERRARALFDGIQDAVFVHDLDGRILDANPAAMRRLGYKREEFLRLTVADIDAPDTFEGFDDRLATQLRDGFYAFEGRHRTKNGQIVPVDINTSVFQFEGRPAVLAVIRDITERKALEEARQQLVDAQVAHARTLEEANRELVRAEARARQLTEGCLDAVIAADTQGHVTQFNPAAERAFGLAAAEVIGGSLDALFPDEAQIPHLRGQRTAPELPAPMEAGRTIEMRARRGDGQEFPVEIALGAVDDGGARQYIASVRDLTERQRMYNVLAQTEKLASIGLLSAGIAHEINNPLAYVSNNLAVLERDLRGIKAMLRAYDDERANIAVHLPDVAAKAAEFAEELDWEYVRDNIDRTLSRTREGVQRVTNIVHNLRSLARTGPPQLEPTSLADVVASAQEIVQGQARKAGVMIETTVEPGLIKIPCAGSQIGQVVLNLLINAVQALDGHVPSGDGQIHVDIRSAPGRQIIEVSDNGPGIAAEDLPRLFDPFFSTKPVGEGTGLGLAFSHGIISGHGGRITVDSRPGQGATFRIELPVPRARSS